MRFKRIDICFSEVNFKSNLVTLDKWFADHVASPNPYYRTERNISFLPVLSSPRYILYEVCSENVTSKLKQNIMGFSKE